MTKYYVGAIIFGLIFLGFIIGLILNLSLSTLKFPNAVPATVLTLLFGFGMIFNIIKYIKTRNITNEVKPQDFKAQQPDTVYIKSCTGISRADGKPISDEEVPYLMEMSLQMALEVEQSRPKRSAREEELEFQFMQKHGVKSQKLCDEFQDLNRAAYEESDINKKIELLQQAIAAFEKAKQWHYNYSKGAKMYFEDFWERMHNSRNNCFSWVDSVEEELQLQIQKRDEIIPWILENSKTGFLQTAIYDEFPENSKSDLRKIIDALAEQSKISKIKKGSSYFITHG